LAVLPAILQYCVTNIKTENEDQNIWRWAILQIISSGFKYISSADLALPFGAPDKIDSSDCLIRSDNSLEIYLAWLKVIRETVVEHAAILHTPPGDQSIISPVACTAVFFLANYSTRHATMMKENHSDFIKEIEALELECLQRLSFQCPDILLFPLSLVANHLQCIFTGPSLKSITIKDSFKVRL
jgi:hypothetical protein